MLILSAADVEAALDLDALVDAVAAAMVDLSAARVSMPARIAASVPERDAALIAMPAYLPAAKALTTKLVSLFPQNRDEPTHQALICCFDPETGAPTAVLDGRVITEARTAAASTLAARLLARADATTVAVIGTGAQARAHARALARDPRVTRVVIAGRRPDAAAALAWELGELLPRELPPGHAAPSVTASDSIEDAVRDADIVTAATHAESPVVRREWLRPGTHVSSVGFNTAGDGEVDIETVRDAVVIVESRAVALAPPPAGGIEINRAIAAGLITADHIRAELGELVAGTATGRTDDAQITLYKSAGVAVQDAAAAALVLRAAAERGLGTNVELGPAGS